MNTDKVIEIINAKGIEQLKNIFALVVERITPENIPSYEWVEPNRAEREAAYYEGEEAEGHFEFCYEETPWYCANIEKELTRFFGVPTELCFESDYGWYFATGEDGHFNTKIKLYDLECDEFDCYELVKKCLPCDYTGYSDNMNLEPFEEAAMEKYNARPQK